MSIQIYERKCEDCGKKFNTYQPIELKCSDCKPSIFNKIQEMPCYNCQGNGCEVCNGFGTLIN